MGNTGGSVNTGMQRFSLSSFFSHNFWWIFLQWDSWRASQDKLTRFRGDCAAALYDLYTSDSLQAALTALYAKLLVIMGQFGLFPAQFLKRFRFRFLNVNLRNIVWQDLAWVFPAVLRLPVQWEPPLSQLCLRWPPHSQVRIIILSPYNKFY